MFYDAPMDWDFSIERNRGVLLPIVLGLFAMIGLTEGGSVERLSWLVYRFVLRILRPAEAAVRRLIVVMARDIVVEPRAKRPARKNSGERKSKGQGKGESQPKRKRGAFFNLFDPPLRFEFGYGPRHTGSKVPFRISVLGDAPDTRHPFLRGLRQPPPQPEPEPAAAAPPPTPKKKSDTVNAANLCRRLFAIMDALKDLQRQARRYALWLAQPAEERRPRRATPLRVGRPPGFRLKPVHEVEEILKECHWLFRSLPKADTS
jgi:hypothetical protein